MNKSMKKNKKNKTLPEDYTPEGYPRSSKSLVKRVREQNVEEKLDDLRTQFAIIFGENKGIDNSAWDTRVWRGRAERAEAEVDHQKAIVEYLNKQLAVVQNNFACIHCNGRRLLHKSTCSVLQQKGKL